MAEIMAMILAGGGGERLGVLTTERAVSAVPFGGKYRIIDFVLSNCSHSGLVDVSVISQHAPTSLHDHIGSGRFWDFDRLAGGVRFMQPYQTRTSAGRYRGTADALTQNLDVVEEARPDRVLVLSGDHVYRMDYRPLIQAHEERGAKLTLAVTRVPSDQSWRFGMAQVGSDGRIVGLEEKPERSTAPFASMGIYLFERETLAQALASKPVDLVLDVVRPMLTKGEPVHAYEFEGYWEDVGTIRTFYRANLELLSPTSRLALLDPRWRILTRDEERPPVMVGESARIERSLVANGCHVHGAVHGSVLFPGVRVAAGAEVRDSIVMADVTLEPGARISHAIVDKYVRLGRDASVGHGELPAGGGEPWLDGLTLVGKDAVIPPGVRIGRAAVVGVGAGPADFPGDALEAGTQMRNRSVFETTP